MNPLLKPYYKATADFVEYIITWLSEGRFEGRWPSASLGGGFNFQEHTLFERNPNPRLIDWPATLRSLYLPQPLVRLSKEERRIGVYVIGDLTRSELFGEPPKIVRQAVVAGALAAAAYVNGDTFSYLGYAENIEINLKPRVDKSYSVEVVRAIFRHGLGGKSGNALKEAARLLPRRKALVVIVSDFLEEPEMLREAFIAINQHHDVLPICLWDVREYGSFEDINRFSLVPMVDMETGEAVLATGGELKRLAKEAYAKKQELIELLSAFGFAPYFLGSDNDILKLWKIFTTRRVRG